MRRASQDVVANKQPQAGAATVEPISKRLPSRTGTRRGADPAPQRVPTAKRELLPPILPEDQHVVPDIAEVLYVLPHATANPNLNKLAALGNKVNVVYKDSAGVTKSLRLTKGINLGVHEHAVQERLDLFVEGSAFDRGAARKSSAALLAKERSAKHAKANPESAKHYQATYELKDKAKKRTATYEDTAGAKTRKATYEDTAGAKTRKATYEDTTGAQEKAKQRKATYESNHPTRKQDVTSQKRRERRTVERKARKGVSQAMQQREEQSAAIGASIATAGLGPMEDHVRTALRTCSEATGYALSSLGEDLVNDPNDEEVHAKLRTLFHDSIVPDAPEISEMANKFLDKLDFRRRNLFACSTCGLRELSDTEYKQFSVAQLQDTCFEYNEDAHATLKALDVDVLLYDDMGNAHTQNLKCIRSYYEHKGKHFHVYPHLVSEGSDGEASSSSDGSPTVRLCATCAKAVTPNATKVPMHSLARCDFGTLSRLNLPKPSLVEQCFLAPTRLYGMVVKVVLTSGSKQRNKIDVTRCKLQGGMIMFPHDGPSLACDLVTDTCARAVASVTSRVKLWLVGPGGKLDVLAKRALKLPELELRPALVHSYMTVRRAIGEARSKLEGTPLDEHTFPKPPTLEAIAVRRLSILAALQKDARLVDEQSVPAAVNRMAMPSDIGRVRSVNPGDTEAEVAPAAGAEREGEGEAGDEGDGAGPEPVDLPVVGLLSAPQDVHQTMQAALHSINKAIQKKEEPCRRGSEEDDDVRGLGGDMPDGTQPPPVTLPPPQAVMVPRSDQAVNEYDDYGEALMNHFLYEFPLGVGLDGARSATGSKDGSCRKMHRHMMLHHSNVFATNTTLMLLLVNVMQRHAVNRAVGLKVANNPEAFAKFLELVADPEFTTLLQIGMKNPKGKEAHDIFTKVLPFISLSGKYVPWGSLERASLVGDILALARRYGPGMNFFSASPHDTHNATTLRLCMHTIGNERFPAHSDPAFLRALQTETLHVYLEDHREAARHIFDVALPTEQDRCLEQAATRNPVATSAVFLELVDVVMDVLFGLAPSRTTGGNATRMTKPFSEWKKGVIGKLAAWMYVIETSGRKALHIHALLFGGLSPRLLACLLGREAQPPEDHSEVEKLVLEALEAHYKSAASWEVHIVDAARRELRLPQVKATFHQPARGEWGNPEGESEAVAEAQADVKLATECHAMNVGFHKTDPHADTCSKGDSGLYGCRMHRPCAHGFGKKPQFCQTVFAPAKPSTPLIELRCPHSCRTSGDVFFGEKCKFRVCNPEPLPPKASLWPVNEQGEADDREEEDVASSEDDDEGDPEEEGGAGKEGDEGGTQQRQRRRSKPFPGTAPLLPNLDTRSINLELPRPDVVAKKELKERVAPKPPPSAKMFKLLRGFALRLERLNKAVELAGGDAESSAGLAAVAEFQHDNRATNKRLREALAIRDVRRMAHIPEVREVLESSAVPPELKDRLDNMSDGPLAARLVAKWRSPKFICRNSLLIEYNELITSLLGCNTAPIPMGCSEGAKSAMFYMIKYVTKDAAAVQESLALLVDAKKHIEQYPSTAEDVGEDSRTARHFVERCVNQLQQEISDTQAAACLLGRRAHGSSVDFKHSYPWEVLRYARALIKSSRQGLAPVVEGEEGDDDVDDEATEIDGDEDEDEAEDEAEDEDEEESLEERLLRAADLATAEDEEVIGDNHWRKGAQLAGGEDPDVEKMSGYARLFKRTTIVGGKKVVDNVPVGEGELYQYRGVHLRTLSYDEWCTSVEIVKMKDGDTAEALTLGLVEWCKPRTGAGRPPNPKFPFPVGHPLRNDYYQKLLSKLPCNKAVGHPAPREPRPLLPGRRPTKTWLQAQADFAAYMLAVYMPWEVEVLEGRPLEQKYPSTMGPGVRLPDGVGPSLSPNAMREWLARLRTTAAAKLPTRRQALAAMPFGSSASTHIEDEREIARGRLFLLHNVNHTLYVSSKKKEASVKSRGRHRDTWSSDDAQKMRKNAAGAGGGDGCFDEKLEDEAMEAISACLHDMKMRALHKERLRKVLESEAWAKQLLKSAVPKAADVGAGAVNGSYADAYLKESKKPYPVDMSIRGVVKATTRDKAKKVADLLDADPPPLAEEGEEEERRRERELDDAVRDDWIPEEFLDMSEEAIAQALAERNKAVDTLLAGYKKALKKDTNLSPPKLPLLPLNRRQREFARRLVPALLKMRRARASGEDRKACGRTLDPSELLHLLHGPAGTGKSVLLQVLSLVLSKYHLGGLAATAYTGVAAAPLGRATTMCSLSGLPPAACFRNVGDYEPPSVGTVNKFQQYAGKCDQLSVLFIDEISFNGPQFLHHLSVRLQHLVGDSTLPFGGVVVILAGDFYQLPPTNSIPLPEALVSQAVFEHLPQAEQDAMMQKEVVDRAKKAGAKERKQRAAAGGADPALEKGKEKGREKDKHEGPSPSRPDIFEPEGKPPSNKGSKHKRAAAGGEGGGGGEDGDGQVAEEPSRYDSMNAIARGTSLFQKFRRFDLKQPMRQDPTERPFAEWLSRFRKTGEAQPVPKELLTRLKLLSETDTRNVMWRFATHGVLSNRERMHLNQAMALDWARYHNVPLVKWRLPLGGIVGRALDPEEAKMLYEEEPGLWGYWVLGAPCMLSRNVNPLLGLANGSDAVYHSLTFEKSGGAYSTSNGESGRFAGGCTVVPDLGFCEVTLEQPPYSVNVCPVLNEDQRSRYAPGQSLVSGPNIVVPILFDHKANREANKVDLVSLKAAMLGLEVKAKATMHMVELAFAVTAHKLQGKTKDRLVVSLGARPFKPDWSIQGLYVLLSRARRLGGLKLSQRVTKWDHLLGQRHSKQMQLWEGSYDEEGWFVPKQAAREQVKINERIAAVLANKKGKAKPKAKAKAKPKAEAGDASTAAGDGLPKAGGKAKAAPSKGQATAAAAKAPAGAGDAVAKKRSLPPQQQQQPPPSKQLKPLGEHTPNFYAALAAIVSSGASLAEMLEDDSLHAMLQTLLNGQMSKSELLDVVMELRFSARHDIPSGVPLDEWARQMVGVVGDPRAAQPTGALALPRGLKNEGNTCYANAMIQLLFAFPLVRDRLATLSDTDVDGWPAAAALRGVFQGLLARDNGGPVSLMPLLIATGRTQQHAQWGRIHCSAEFASLVMHNHYPEGHTVTTLFSEAFAFTASELAPLACGCRPMGSDDEPQGFPYPLSLPPQTDSAIADLTIDHVLNRSWSEMVVTGMTCEQEDGRMGHGLQRDSVRRFRIRQLPAFLGLQLRRGETDDGSVAKDDRPVAVGATLDLSRFLDDPTTGRGRASYELVGVVLHNHNHYTTLAFDDAQNQWHLLNDAVAARVLTLDEVLTAASKHGVVMAYRHIDPAAGGPAAAQPQPHAGPAAGQPQPHAGLAAVQPGSSRAHALDSSSDTAGSQLGSRLGTKKRKAPGTSTSTGGGNPADDSSPEYRGTKRNSIRSDSYKTQLADARLSEQQVVPDGHCAYYSVLCGRGRGVTLDPPTAIAMRRKAAKWFASADARPFLRHFGERLVICKKCREQRCNCHNDPACRDKCATLRGDIMNDPDIVREDSESETLRTHPSWYCKCYQQHAGGMASFDSFVPNQPGIALTTADGIWGGDAVIKALAVLEETDIAVVSKHNDDIERTRVYCADVTPYIRYCSWKDELVPRLQKQQKGAALGHMRVSRASGGQVRPVRPLRVVVYNGHSHYDGTRPRLTSALHGVSTTACGARCKHHNFHPAGGLPKLPLPRQRTTPGLAALTEEVDPGGLTNVGYRLHREHPGLRIGTMLAGNSGRPGGACGAGPHCARPDLAKLHAGHSTQEEDVVSNWLLTHSHNVCGTGTGTPRKRRRAGAQEEHEEEHESEFSATIAERWGFEDLGVGTGTATRQGIDYTRAGPASYLDAWTVTEARLSAKVAGGRGNRPNRYDHTKQYPTTLCFVSGPNAGAMQQPTGSVARTLNTAARDSYAVFRACVKSALTAGLRAMAAEGCTVALLAGVSTALYAGAHRATIVHEYADIVAEILADEALNLAEAFDHVVYTTLR